MNDYNDQGTAIEPIMSAFGAASKSVGDWYPLASSDPELPDERVHRLIGRLARRCFGRMEELRRSAYLLGQDVGRAVRLYSRSEGLLALAERIEKDFGKHVTPQKLGNALTIYQSYSRDEYENRFSDLSDTHLLKAQQLKGDIREERNLILDNAQQLRVSVSDMVREVKRSQQLQELEDRLAKREAMGPPDLGYMRGSGEDELERLPDSCAALIRIRDARPASLMRNAARVLAHDGLMVLHFQSVADFYELRQFASGSQIRVLHALIVQSTDVARAAPKPVPVVDHYRLLVLLSMFGRMSKPSEMKRMVNPMTTAQAESLIYRLIPPGGTLIDVGPASISTAAFSAKHGREYLAVAPQEDRKTEEACSPDAWPEVPKHVRAVVTIAGKTWDELACCERTIVAAVLAGRQPQGKCTQCSKLICSE